MARYKTKVIRFDDCVSITVPNEDLDEFEWMLNTAVPVDYVSELREKFIEAAFDKVIRIEGDKLCELLGYERLDV